jgi:hypothetical protein
LVIISITLLGGACVDARQAFDDYHGRIPDAAPADAAPIVSTLPDVTGQWFAVAHPPVDGKFFYLEVTYGFTAVTTNTAKLEFSAQPLDYTTMAPVGDPFVAHMVPVDMNANADIPMNGLLPAAANDISGTEVTVAATVHATLVSTDFICGTLTGQAGPLDLTGTTFGAQRITGSTLPSPISACQ